MKEKSTRCKICNGRGYLPCDCWPGDCICGWGDEECEYCEGTGRIYQDDDREFPAQPAAQEGEEG